MAVAAEDVVEAEASAVAVVAEVAPEAAASVAVVVPAVPPLPLPEPHEQRALALSHRSCCSELHQAPLAALMRISLAALAA